MFFLLHLLLPLISDRTDADVDDVDDVNDVEDDDDDGECKQALCHLCSYIPGSLTLNLQRIRVGISTGPTAIYEEK